MLFHVCHICSGCSWLLTVAFSLSCMPVGPHPLSFWGVLLIGFVEFISRTESGNLRADVVEDWASVASPRAEVDDIRSELTCLLVSVKQTDLGESDPWVKASALFGAVSLDRSHLRAVKKRHPRCHHKSESRSHCPWRLHGFAIVLTCVIRG